MAFGGLPWMQTLFYGIGAVVIAIIVIVGEAVKYVYVHASRSRKTMWMTRCHHPLLRGGSAGWPLPVQ
jgi:hypothetical protein